MSPSLAGFTVGVIVADSAYPLLPGNMQHAASYGFPVLYAIVPDVTYAELYEGADTLRERVLAAGDELIAQGVSAIVGACGSFAYFQPAAREHFRVPTAMSVMVTLPFVLSMLALDQKVGVIFASRAAYTQRLLAACGVNDADARRIVVDEADACPAFRDFSAGASFDPAVLCAEVTQLACGMVSREPNLAAIMLHCSDLPPFAASIGAATGLPVFDGVLLAQALHASLTRRPYADF